MSVPDYEFVVSNLVEIYGVKEANIETEDHIAPSSWSRSLTRSPESDLKLNQDLI